MEKSDELIADIVLYGLTQIQKAKTDCNITGDDEYWNGEINSMKYLLIYIDKLLDQQRKMDSNLPNLSEFFERMDEPRKKNFTWLKEETWDGIVVKG